MFGEVKVRSLSVFKIPFPLIINLLSDKSMAYLHGLRISKTEASKKGLAQYVGSGFDFGF